jgi:hypothetical protein
MVKYIASKEHLALFTNGDQGAVVDTKLNLVVEVSELSTYKTQGWYDQSEVTEDVQALAASALQQEPINAGGSRLYTIPGGAQAEAKKALEWRKKHKRGGTPVGLNTARTLAKGGQIGIEKIRHIAKYFPRHEVDKKGKGYEPGEDNFPSNGRIAWALWGGDAAQRWASAIVERENKKAVAAGGYQLVSEDVAENYSYDSDMNAFKEAHELDASFGPEFMARVCLDGSGIDRLYKIEIDGTVCVWDDCTWDTLGHVDGDVYSYDAALDDVYDLADKTHIMIDPSSAIIISALLQESPFKKVSIEDIDEEEFSLFANAMAEVDYEIIDRIITAAGEPTTNADGVYTPDERSENASKQVRDATGRFATVGQRVAVGGDTEKGAGTVTRLDAKNGLIDVKLDSGRTITIASKYSQPLKSEMRRGNAVRVSNNENEPIDMSGILGEPRTPYNQPKAHLPGTLPPLTSEELELMLSDFPKYVANMRKSYKPSSAADKARAKKEWGVKKFAGENSIVAAGEPEAEEKPLTPNTTDVPPKYLAIVSPDDPSAVMDMIALVPETTTATNPVVYKRKDQEWVRDDQVLMNLKSATPPDVVKLEGEKVVNDVLLQVDGLSNVKASAYSHLINFWSDSIVAAGGLDRNRGNAEELRRYWTKGKGAAKIRWGTPGDWTRCVRNLSKYMGPRAKGYCQLRHKEVTGIYTGDRKNPGNDFATKVIEVASLAARAVEAKERFSLVASADSTGAKFYIPLVIPEDLESGDGRKFKSDAIEIRELPLPLMWQIKTGEGHNGSVVVGRIDYMERTEDGIGNAYGVFDTGAYGREAERLVRNGFIRGVSADLDKFEAEEEDADENSEKDGKVGKSKLTINQARVMAVTIVAKPAFQECTIAIEDDYSANQEDEVIPEDGIYEESVDSFVGAEALLASGFLESEIPVVPPQNWFENPKLTKPTPLTVDPSGRICGHIAAWHVNHIGMPRSTRPPRSKSNYAYFQTGVVRTDAGKDIPVGQLTLAGGHADLRASASQAAKHYDDTASAIADVCAGEDEHGIWVSGSLRPGATEMQIRALRASAPSGDWRPINGSLELVAVCQVNVPGFPIARALVASGKVMALVAAGANYMAILKSEHVEHFATKAQLLSQLSSMSPDLKSRVKAAKKSARTFAVTSAARKAADLKERALVASAIAELAKFSDEERTKLADKGFALPDGSFPIRNEDDLRNAIRAYGRAEKTKRVTVRKHIMKRARALRKEYLVPEDWTNAGSAEATSIVASMRAKITEFAESDNKEISEKDLEELRKAQEEADKQTEEEIKAAEDVADGKTTVEDTYDEDGRTKFTPKTQPRDAKGKYRKVLARLKQDLGVAGLQRALLKARDAENLEFAGNYGESAKASQELLGLIDRLDTKALNPQALENVKATARELGTVIANLPLPFGKDASKLRFSDLPSGLKDLIEQMISRVETKIGKEDADIATQSLKSYMSGADVYSQGEVQSEMSKLLRLLT